MAAALESGITPLEHMLAVLRDENSDAAARAWAAEKAAPYLHSRPATLEPVVHLELPETNTVDGVGKAIDAVISAVATGQLAPGQGQSVVGLIEARRRVIETEELAARITALEEATSGKK